MTKEEKVYNRVNTFSSINGIEKLERHMQNNETGSFLYQI